MTRKKDVYALLISTLGEKNQSLWVIAWTRPTTAKSVASAIPIAARARVIQSGNGARATTATSVANGKRK